MKKILLLSLFLLITVALVGCGEQHIYLCKDGSLGAGQVVDSNKVVYHCPDGKQTLNYNACKFEKPLKITSEVAEEKALTFVEGYAKASGWNSRLVTVYPEDGSWYAQIVLSKRDEVSFETLVRVNGTQGVVTCEENCDYQS